MGQLSATDSYALTPSWTLAAQAGHGTVTLESNGSFSYVPTGSYVGLDSFTVTAADSNGDTVTQTINVDVENTIQVQPNAWALAFGGSSYAVLSPPAAAAGASLSFVAAIKAATLPAANSYEVIASRSGAFTLAVDSSGHLCYATGSSTTFTQAGTATLNSSNFNMVALTVDGASGALNVYLNGLDVYSTSGVTLAAASGTMTLGANSSHRK